MPVVRGRLSVTKGDLAVVFAKRQPSHVFTEKFHLRSTFAFL